MIGSFGEAIFEISDKRILTFTSFTRNVSIRKEAHNSIGQKPKTEVIGPELDSISFTITLNKNLGIDVRHEMDRWVAMVREGEAHMLIIGNKALGVDLWLAESISESWDVISVNGTIISGKINVTLQEYVR
jgi:hypothetical protein